MFFIINAFLSFRLSISCSTIEVFLKMCLNSALSFRYLLFSNSDSVFFSWMSHSFSIADNALNCALRSCASALLVNSFLFSANSFRCNSNSSRCNKIVIIIPEKARPVNNDVRIPKLSPKTPTFSTESSGIGWIIYKRISAYVITVSITPRIRIIEIALIFIASFTSLLPRNITINSISKPPCNLGPHAA